MRTLLKIVNVLPSSWRTWIFQTLIRIDDRELAHIEVKLATTANERVQASRLLHDAYVARGLLEPQPLGLRVTPHLFEPTTAIFVAKEGPTVIGTMALILDSPVGLPMDAIYGEELRALRRRRRRIAEVGALCVAPGHRRLGVAFLLNKIMWRCAREVLSIDQLVIAVHPDVREVYRDTLMFESFGGEKTYPGLNRRALAVALRLDVRRSVWNGRRKWGHLGASKRNLFHLYVERREPLLRMPRPADLDAAAAVQRRIGGTLLGKAAPARTAAASR